MAVFAVLSLLLSALALASPTAANHKGFDHQPLPIDTAGFGSDSQDCEDVELEPGQVLLHWIANQQNVTEPITLTLHYAGGGSATIDSTKWNEPGQIDGNVTHHFYLEVTGDVVVTDLDLSTGEGNVRLSHVCRGTDGGVADDAGILIQKVDENGARLAGAVFTVEGVSGEFTTGTNGRVCVDGLPQGATLLVTEIQAPPGYQLADPASQLVEVDKDGCDSSPEVIFVNTLDEGEQPVEAVTVSIMKHLCEEITSVEQFEALEASAGSELEALVATVVACPTIVFTGDIPTSGAITGGAVNFDFSIVDADGTQTLAVDGGFMPGVICESDVDLDADGSGTIDADVCLDVSHYQFEVVDGVVVITETEAPDGSTGFGTLRFTPGSGDETALANSLADVEATGVIQLDTSAASDSVLADGIMLHVYNFAAAQPGNGGEAPGEEETPRGGQLPGQGGPGQGQLPDTATTPFPTGSVPAALLALVMLTGLGAAGVAVQVEARRRR